MAGIRKTLAHPNFPLVLLLAINLLAGLLTFRDYGLSWDEPLFYNYGDAIGYAYSIPEHLSGDFNLEHAYGSSGDDHKTRGPAYLVLSRGPVYGIEALTGVERYEAWHLVNFLTFQTGAALVYLLIHRVLTSGGWSRWAAFAGTALFTWQPLLWGHAFINPKDPSFLVFFSASFLAGLRMVDEINRSDTKPARLLMWAALAGVLLGAATAIRILAPLAGVLVFVYAFFKNSEDAKPAKTKGKTIFAPARLKTFLWFIPYGMTASLSMLALWPYLWEEPLRRFGEVFQFMSANPTQLQVLFNGQMYRAYDLPRRYLPVYLLITLSEPVWPLFFVGLATAAWRTWKKALDWIAPALLLAWFAIPSAYVLLKRPPMYDGFRHFLFIVPPIFIFAGLGIDALFNLIGTWMDAENAGKNKTASVHPRLAASYTKIGLKVTLGVILLLPGLLAMPKLHPYEYTYYNSFIGGTRGAFRQYETDYWLTCYKETMQEFNQITPNARLIVHRESYIAAAYAAPGLTVLDYRGEGVTLQPGDYFLVTSRLNEDIRVQRGLPVVFSVGREDAKFCTIKQVK